MRFRDRPAAGRILARELGDYAHRDDVIVLGLPRGGVPVAFEVAEALGAELDVFIVRKLGVPGEEELAMGAIASGGGVLNGEVIEQLGIPDEEIDAVIERECGELERRERVYRGGRLPPDVRGRTVVLVDDGLATGSTMRAAAAVLHDRQPASIVVAVPVAPPEICAALRSEVDRVVCLTSPESFSGVGEWYEDFSQTRDDEVRALLARAAQRIHSATRHHG